MNPVSSVVLSVHVSCVDVQSTVRFNALGAAGADAMGVGGGVPPLGAGCLGRGGICKIVPGDNGELGFVPFRSGFAASN